MRLKSLRVGDGTSQEQVAHGLLSLGRMRIVVLALVAFSVCGPSSYAAAGTPGWGARSQVGQMVREVDSRNAPARRATFLRTQPLIQKLAAFLRPGLSVKNDVKKLAGFLKETEERFGEPISRLDHPALKDGERMRAEKALALLRYDRRPSEVTETFVRTTAKVEGVPLADRDLFVQRWRPIGKPSGKVFVIAPGFLETGRNYYEQAQLLNAQGHEVVIMDQQWAGYSADVQKGVVKGGIDRGFGIARDVAEAAAYGNEILEHEYGQHPDKQLVLVGTSMGGGPGLLGALKLYDAGRIKLGAGRSIPENRGWILQDAFLGRTKSVINNTLNFLGRVPGIRDIALYAMGVPLLSAHAGVNAKNAAHAVSEDIRGRPQAFRAALADITEILGMIKDTGAPKGRGYIIHSKRDYLANPKIILDAYAQMKGAPVELNLLPGRDHVIEERPGEQRTILDGAKFVANPER
jgi:pimeloyl-ACP methyl ester carboxylesterase